MAAAISLAVILGVIGMFAYLRWSDMRGVPFHPWQFCPLCRARLETAVLEGKNRRKCTSCSFVHWDNPRPVAVLLIPTLDGGLVLIRRNVDPRKGKVALPGGFVDSYEDLFAGAIREAEEETGIKIEIDREWCRLMPPGVNEHLHFILAKPTDQKPRKGSDAAEAFVAYRDNIPADMAFPTHAQVIQEWLRATA